MNIRKMLADFAIPFSVAWVVGFGVTFLWNLVVHGSPAVDWETSTRFALIFGVTYGIVLPWSRARESKTSQKGE